MTNGIIEVGFLSLVPSLVTLLLAFMTKEVLTALFFGLLSGCGVLWYLTGDISQANVVEVFLLPALSSDSYAFILLIYLWCLGGILGLWGKTGSAAYFAEKMGKKIAHGPRSSLLFSWFLGMVFHQGGTISTILTGTTVKPVCDHYRVSHEELAYVVDSTASPVATIVPFNAWPLYISGVVLGAIPLVQTDIQAFNLYISSLRYNFYAIIAVILTLLFALGWLPWVGKSMAVAIKRARETGKLDHSHAQPMLTMDITDISVAPDYQPSLFSFVVPILTLLGVSIVPFILSQMGWLASNKANWTKEAFFLAAVLTILIAKFRGMHTKDILEGYLSGCKEMTMGAMIFAMAIGLGIMTKELQTADYLIQLLPNHIPNTIVPVLLMGMCMGVAFATGSSFGTYAVVFPIALPLAYSLNADPVFIQVCFGAVLGGTVFGDQCSPISDTTIFSSMFTGCDLMDHVKTQLPLALLAAGLAAGCSMIAVATR